MAQGRLGAAMISSSNVWEQFYQVPVGKTASVTINICNQTANKAAVRIALTTSTNVQTEDVIEYNVAVYPSESFQRSGIILSTGQYIYVRSDVAVGVNIWGYEEELA